MELVAFLGKDKENWGQLGALINRAEWTKVIIVHDKSAADFPLPMNGELIEIDSNTPIKELKELMKEKLKKALSREFEVALSIASGTGKEHMALISALLNIPVGIKIVVFTKDGIDYIN